MPFELERFKKTLCVQGAVTGAELVAGHAVLKTLDKTSEAKASWWQGWALVMGLPGLLLTFFWGIGIPFVLVALVFWFVGSRHRRYDLEDRRYELLLELAHLLRRDAAPDERMELRLDCRTPELREKHVGKGKAGLWGVDFYRDPWLDLRATLLDGTRLWIEVEDRVQARSRSKRSASGKWKTKRKRKTRVIVSVALRVKSARYGDLRPLAAEMKAAVRVPSGAALLHAEVSERDLTASATCPQGTELACIATIIASFYHGLGFTQRLERFRRQAEGQAA